MRLPSILLVCAYLAVQCAAGNTTDALPKVSVEMIGDEWRTSGPEEKSGFHAWRYFPIGESQQRHTRELYFCWVPKNRQAKLKFNPRDVGMAGGMVRVLSSDDRETVSFVRSFATKNSPLVDAIVLQKNSDYSSWFIAFAKTGTELTSVERDHWISVLRNIVVTEKWPNKPLQGTEGKVPSSSTEPEALRP